MTYAAWTGKAVESRILEMADTIRILPAHRGPKMFGSSMPEPIGGQPEAYGRERARIRETASAGAISRMEEAWGWINALDDASDRRLIYAWSWVKVRKGMKISAFASQNEMNDRMLRRQIDRICDAISEQLNRHRQPRLNSEDCSMSENTAQHASTTVTSEKCATYWRAPDAKPQIDPASPPERLLDHRAIRAR